VDTDDAARAPGDPEPRPGPGSGPATRPDTDIADEALDAMTRAVASLRDQAARMINTAPINSTPINAAPINAAPINTVPPPALPPQDPPGDT